MQRWAGLRGSDGAPTDGEELPWPTPSPARREPSNEKPTSSTPVLVSCCVPVAQFNQKQEGQDPPCGGTWKPPPGMPNRVEKDGKEVLMVNGDYPSSLLILLTVLENVAQPSQVDAFKPTKLTPSTWHLKTPHCSIVNSK